MEPIAFTVRKIEENREQQAASTGSPYPKLQTSFTMPALDEDIEIEVSSTVGMHAGSYIFIENVGHYYVKMVNSSTSMTITNKDIDGNAAPGTSVYTGADIIVGSVIGNYLRQDGERFVLPIVILATDTLPMKVATVTFANTYTTPVVGATVVQSPTLTTVDANKVILLDSLTGTGCDVWLSKDAGGSETAFNGTIYLTVMEESA
jgi:hypothetical protein